MRIVGGRFAPRLKQPPSTSTDQNSSAIGSPYCVVRRLPHRCGSMYFEAGRAFWMDKNWPVWTLIASAGQARTALAARLALLTFAAILSLSGCSTTISPARLPPSPAPSHAAAPGHVVTASWYGAEFSGRRTSNGEVFNPNGLTAASRTLPIGSRVRVTNVSNGRTVVVRINDRGPYIKGRGIDLSHAAAQHIGLTRKGVGRVAISRADGGTPSPPALSRVSYTPAAAPWSGPRWRAWPSSRQAHARRRHHGTRRRIVSNPIGDWIFSALPHF